MDGIEEVFVATIDDLAIKEVVCVESGGTQVAVFHVEGEFFAIGEMCTHEDASLADGYVIGCVVECPWHMARFDLRTGKVVRPPATKGVPVYEVAARDGAVYVKLPAHCPVGP